MIKQEQILLHEDSKLAEILGLSIVSREQIQAWPLSFVERIVLSDNTSRIYKAFYNLPIESVLENRRLAADPQITQCTCPNTLCDWHLCRKWLNCLCF